jgi:transcriptional regulator with XRE-family HTH domain
MKDSVKENRLRELRDRSRLTLQEVSILTGYSVPTISRHESGERSLSEEAILKYSSLYKVHSYELFNIAVGDDE